MSSTLQTVLLSSLAKVLPNEKPTSAFYENPMCCLNESFNFQIAYSSENPNWLHQYIHIEIDSKLKDYISISSVELVPSNFPCYAGADADYLMRTPGLLPDLLMPLKVPAVKVMPTQWRSLWFCLTPPADLTAGDYPVTISLKDGNGNIAAKHTFTLSVLNTYLPKQKTIHTEWFHTDGIAQFYNVPVFSERYWDLVANFMQTAAKHSVNMVLTPLFTPPLDTEVGGERLTVQLVDIELDDLGHYHFNFDKLAKWIKLATEAGMEYFEMSHLFTQWGANATPKIMVRVNGELQKRFGWHVAAKDESYKAFLDAFLPALKNFLDSQGLQGKCYFHISDEPSLDQIDNYKEAHDLVQGHLEGYPLMDALSNLEFYEKGIIDYPVCANDHITPFIEAKVPNLWAYYCCAQSVQVSNRFMALPSFRNRILGVQLYKYHIPGFLHWGYNFYNSHLSKRAINPFLVTDADMTFPSGDAFLVYPGEKGALESIRLKVLAEAFYDIRAFELLESLTSREEVLALIEENTDEPITFSVYPRTETYLLKLREKVNAKIAELV